MCRGRAAALSGDTLMLPESATKVCLKSAIGQNRLFTGERFHEVLEGLRDCTHPIIVWITLPKTF